MYKRKCLFFGIAESLSFSAESIQDNQWSSNNKVWIFGGKNINASGDSILFESSEKYV